jgi:hypothetical protein
MHLARFIPRDARGVDQGDGRAAVHPLEAVEHRIGIVFRCVHRHNKPAATVACHG